ncbi:hypothetical protein FSP39_011698 [Pinctada imbricata]|uniref:Uncharacterized protein n=1 Tax=Pinctada imbricata TaxID=66713 RepID=A0AA88Y764_PINIB|nr:hypothetical protein FSP39_011698 [Pinctada imbricata]
MGNRCRLRTAICHGDNSRCGYPGLRAHIPPTFPIGQRSRRTYICGIKEPPHCQMTTHKRDRKTHGPKQHRRICKWISKDGVRNTSRALPPRAHRWTKDLCHMDSDGDGRTNGQELGDPDCLWSPGNDSVLSDYNITHPGICEPLNDINCRKENAWLQCNDDFKCDGLKDPDVRHFDLRLPNSTIPANETTLLCIILDVPTNGDYHIIGSTPIVDNSDLVHHIMVYGCSEKVRENVVGKAYECLLSPGGACGKELIAGWAVGLKGECLDPKVGFRMGSNGYKKMALQVHWNNPTRENGRFDSSGLKIYYTANRRQYDAGFLNIGQQSIVIPPSQKQVIINATCSSECTNVMFKERIFIFWAVSHMHLLGRKENVTLYRGGKYLRHIIDESNFDFKRASHVNFPQPVEVLPGDELRTTCVYDSSGRDSTTYYGLGTNSEMCFAFMKYFPKENIPVPMCLAFKDLQMCKAMPEYMSSFPEGIRGCNFHNFNLSDPTTIKLVLEIRMKCVPDQCRPGCKVLINKVKKHPCFHGEMYEYIKFFLVNVPLEESYMKHLGMDLRDRLTSCDTQIAEENGFHKGKPEMISMTQEVTEE